MMICAVCGGPVDLNEAVITPATTSRSAVYKHEGCARSAREGLELADAERRSA